MICKVLINGVVESETKVVYPLLEKSTHQINFVTIKEWFQHIVRIGKHLICNEVQISLQFEESENNTSHLLASEHNSHTGNAIKRFK